jgi:hypothetical protein
MFTQNTYTLPLLLDETGSTSTSVGATVDLANYFDVGKREIKFVLAHVWGSTVAATAETVTIYCEELDSSASAGSTVTGTALTAVTVTSTAGGEAAVEIEALVTKRYIRAKAVASAATGFFGVVALALPHRRFAQ